MQFFLDTADLNEIKEAASWGILDGITTNPTHVAKSGKSFVEVLREIVAVVPGPVSAEVTAVDFAGMMKQAHFLAGLAPNIVIKVPIIAEGLKTIKALSDEGIKVNVTLCFSSVQALLAAKAGATYISPFIGRVDDIAQEGMDTVREIRAIYDNYGFETKILTASTRSALHIRDAALAGSDVATMPLKVFKSLIEHPLTDVGLKRFQDDWNKIPRDKQDI